MDICEYVRPAYKEVEEGHFCACHLYNTPEENEQCKVELKKQQELERITKLAKEDMRVFKKDKKKKNEAEKPAKDEKESNGEEKA